MNGIHKVGVSVIAAAMLASIASTAFAHSNVKLIPESGKRESVAYLQVDGTVKVTVELDCTEGEALTMWAGIEQGKGLWADRGESPALTVTCDATGHLVQDLYVAPYDGASFKQGGAQGGVNINGASAVSRKLDIQ